MATKRRNLPPPRHKCKGCKTRWALEVYVKRNCVWLKFREASFYFWAISWMEWRVHAMPGDWIVASSKTWCKECFGRWESFHGILDMLKRDGLVDIDPGVWPNKPLRIRRRTLDEVKQVVQKRKLTEKQMKLREWIATGGSTTKKGRGHVGDVSVYASMPYMIDGKKYEGEAGGVVNGSVVERRKQLVSEGGDGGQV